MNTQTHEDIQREIHDFGQKLTLFLECFGEETSPTAMSVVLGMSAVAFAASIAVELRKTDEETEMHFHNFVNGLAHEYENAVNSFRQDQAA